MQCVYLSMCVCISVCVSVVMTYWAARPVHDIMVNLDDKTDGLSGVLTQALRRYDVSNGACACIGPSKPVMPVPSTKSARRQRGCKSVSIHAAHHKLRLVFRTRPLSFISLSHSDNQSESATKFYNSFKADVGGYVLTLT